MTTHYARSLWQRLISALTALVMVLGMLPFTSQAAQTAPLAPTRADLLAEPELAAAIHAPRAPQAPTDASGPGGVDTNLALWLRADAGVTESGGVVSDWTDQSANGTVASQSTVGDRPTIVNEAMNFNPALDFDNNPNLTVNQFLSFPSTSMPRGSDDRTFIVVASRDTVYANYSFVIGYGNTTSTPLYNGVTLLGAVGDNPTNWDGGPTSEGMSRYHTPGNLDWPAGTPAIVSKAFTTIQPPNQESYLFYNTKASELNPFRPSESLSGIYSDVTDTGGRIGAYPNYDPAWSWDGQIAEVIVYSSTLQGTTEMQKIESYLALKYGITLSGTHYLDSAGTVVWNATTNAAYNNDIAGLGRDDASGLNQLKSKSVNSSARVTIDTDSFANDKAFWIWGHDGDAASYTTTGAPIGLEVLERTWKAQSTNLAATDSVTICTLLATADYLLLDADGVFSSGAISHTLTSGCASGIDATSGAFFTFAQDDTTTEDIHNQDGIGYSGMIPANPLPDDLMMTSYQDWPDGYNDGAFIGSVYDGENTWLVPYNANQVVKIAPDGTMTEYSDWPAGYTKSLAAFEGGVFDGQNIWLVPHVADQLIKIDKDTGDMTAYSDWPSGVNLWIRSFVGGVFDGQYIWLIPFSASHLVRVNPADGSMTSYDWPAGYVKGFWAFRGGVFDGQNVWLIPYYSTHLIKVNTNDGSMEMYNNWPTNFIKTGAAFAGGVFDGDNLWMIPFYADRVVKFDTTTETMTDYNNWPTGFFKTLGAFYGGGFDGQYIWMTPATANQVIRVDKDSGAMTGYNGWPPDFYKLGRYFYGGSFDGNGMWFAPLIADRAIRLHKIPPAAPIVSTPVNGSVTDLDPLPFTGTADPGTTVVVSDDQGNVLCTAVADGTGNWSCTPAATGDGSYDISVVAIDDGGNASDPTDVGVTVDSGNPPLAVTSPVSGTAINTDPPTFTGTSEPGAAITVTDSLDLCTATADGSGNWSCTPSAALGEDNHDVTVTADDGVGNTSTVPLSFEIDQTAPAAPDITEPISGTTTGLIPTFAGTGEAGGTLTLYDASDTSICTTTVAADGSWHCTPDTELATGEQTLTATVTDPAGNEGTAAPVTITASDDTIAPDPPDVTEPVSGTTTTTLTPTFAGTGESGATINVYDADGNVICTTEVDGSKNWTCTPAEEQEEGDQSYSVTATDAVGNESYPPEEVAVTVAAPSPSLAYCPGGVCTPALWLRADTEMTATNDMTVTAWADLVGTNTFTVTGDPQMTTDALNFNPVVAFDGDGDYLVGDTDITFVEAFAAAQTITDAGRLLAGDGTAVDGNCGAYFFNGTNNIVIGDADPDYLVASDVPYASAYRLLNAALLGGTSATDSRISVNGAVQLSAGHSTNSLESFTRTPLVGVCGTYEVASEYEGNIAEVIVYENELSAADRLKVDSYLALKYGITLSNTLNYVLSDTVVWDATDNATYYNDVAGIVLDSGSALTQTKSRSVNDDSLVTMSGTLSVDASALVWGNNDGTTTMDQSIDGYTVMSRTWRVAETGTVGSVTLMVPDSLTATVLLVSDSTDFSTATAYALTDDGNGNLTASVDFTNGQYFTFGNMALTACPGGVCTPALWLRAEDAEGSATVTAWDDLVGTNTFTVTGDPQVMADALNFNPVVAFDGDGDYLVGDTDITFVEAFAAAQTITDGGRLLAGDGPAVDGNCGAYFFNGTDNIYIGDADPDYLVASDVPYATDYRLLNAALLGGASATDSRISVNGAIQPSAGLYTTNSLESFTRTPLVGVCGTDKEASAYEGNVAEVIVYENELSAADRLKVDSYLALKYGVTLSNTLNYVLSDTVVWDATANADYYNDMAAIVMDNASALAQTQSRSINDDSLITMGSPTDLSDGEALLWGNNDANATIYNQIAGSYQHVARIWRVQETGDVVSVTVTVADSNAKYILVSDSTDFSSATAYPVGSSINFVNDQYFTLAQDAGTVNPPTVSSPISGTVINDPTPTFTGTADPGSPITVTTHPTGTVLCTATAADPGGAWTCTPTTDLPEGDNTIAVVAGDGAGNESDPTYVGVPVDTIAPFEPTISAPVTGTTVLTNTPTFTGTGESSGTVNIYDADGNIVCTTDVDGDGNWTCTPDNPLDEGEQTYTATVTDEAGNESDPDEVTFTVDSGAVMPLTVTEPVTGTAISDLTPTFSGTGDPGATISVTQQPTGTLLFTTTVDAHGDWTYTPTTDLPEDDLSVEVIQIDPAGNVGDPIPIDFTLDITAPAKPTVTEPVTGTAISDLTPTFSGTGEPGATISVTTQPTGTVLCTATVDAQGDWSCTPTTNLPEGPVTAHVVQTDPAGNVSDPTPVDFTVDTIAPAAPEVTAPVTGTTTTDPTPPFVGTGEPGATISVTNDSGVLLCATTVDENGDWSCEPDGDLPEGEQTATVVQIDPAGNVSDPTPVTFTVDSIAPDAPEVTAPATGTTTTDPTPPFVGTGEPGATISVTNESGVLMCETTVDENGDWSCEPDSDLPEGEQTATVVQIDPAGNVSDPTDVTFTVDLGGVPIAANDTYTLPENVPARPSNALNVLENDTDPDGDTITITAVSAPAHGVATIQGTHIVYTSTTGFTGSDSFTYTISDGVREDSATVDVTVMPVADLEVEQDISYTPSGIVITLVARNNGPRPAAGVVITDSFPPILATDTITWTCESAGGAACSGGATLQQTFRLYDMISTFPSGGVLTYTVNASLTDNAIEYNTVAIIPPDDVWDIDMDNNSDTQPTRYRIILPVIYKNADFSTP